MAYSEFGDDMLVAGIAAGILYGYTFPPPYQPHKCPGCQPCPADSGDAERWTKWHSIDAKWVARGALHMCPIVRGETLPPVLPQVRPTLPHPSEIFGPRLAVVPVAEPIAAEVAAPVPVETPSPVQRKARKVKAPVTPEGQSSLF
jgi:hypothetical protein